MVLIAYDAGGRVIATLEQVWNGTEPVDLEAHEEQGLPLLDYWRVSGATGSGTWPQTMTGLDERWMVELDAGEPLRIRALINTETGHRLER